MPLAPLLLTLALHAPADLESRRNALKTLLKEQWEYSLRESPETATSLGDRRYNDRWSDYSLGTADRYRRETQAWLRRFEAINPRGFPEQEALSRTLMIRGLKDGVEWYSLGLDLMPVTQFSGPHIGLPQVAGQVPAATQKDADDYLARLHALPKVFADTQAVLLEGRRRKLEPPAFLLAKVAGQCREIAAKAGEQSPFASPLLRMPPALADAHRASIVSAIDGEVRPAYLRFAEFVERDYAPFGRKEPGLWALPHGDRIYRYAVRQGTTTSLSPEEIHQTGLREVARIHAEMNALARARGYADRKAFEAFLKTDPTLVPASPQAILDRFRGYIDGMRPMLPKLFNRIPKAALEVRAIPDYEASSQAAAYYMPSAPDGSRPGAVCVNTGDYAHRSLLIAEVTAYHEGIPGHHMQISLAQELTDLPEFRRNGGYTAYTEGWALYCEGLSKELGRYQDPISDYGRLSAEVWRACRLVLDTGVHAKRWTRQQMVDYLHENADLSEPDVQIETDRYIANPGQALGYKVGQMEILARRQEAERELGTKFDLRAFHDEVLDAGPLPLDLLRARIEAWIRVTKG